MYKIPDPLLEAQRLIDTNPLLFKNDALTQTTLTIALFEYGKKMIDWYKGEPAINLTEK